MSVLCFLVIIPKIRERRFFMYIHVCECVIYMNISWEVCIRSGNNALVYVAESVYRILGFCRWCHLSSFLHKMKQRGIYTHLSAVSPPFIAVQFLFYRISICLRRRLQCWQRSIFCRTWNVGLAAILCYSSAEFVIIKSSPFILRHLLSYCSLLYLVGFRGITVILKKITLIIVYSSNEEPNFSDVYIYIYIYMYMPISTYIYIYTYIYTVYILIKSIHYIYIFYDFIIFIKYSCLNISRANNLRCTSTAQPKCIDEIQMAVHWPTVARRCFVPKQRLCIGRLFNAIFLPLPPLNALSWAGNGICPLTSCLRRAPL